jgi:ribosomal protein S18 acetylase RimI-like enzyme
MTQSIKTTSVVDIPTILQLITEFYAESGYAVDRELTTHALRELLEKPELGQLWLLMWDGKPAGYILLTVRFSMEYGGLDAFIDDLFVKPDFRRRGLGRLGMQTLFTECQRRDVRAVHVEVGRDNGPAQSLYAQFGMRLVDRQKLTCQLSERATAIE